MKSAFGYVSRIVRFAFTRNPALYVAVFLSIVSVAIELAAVNALLPLSALATGHLDVMEKSVFARLIGMMGVAPSFVVMAMIFLGLLMLRVSTQVMSLRMTQLYGRRILAQLATEAFSTIIRHRQIKNIEDNTIGYFISLAGDEAFRASTIVTSLIQLIGVSILVVLYFSAIVAFSLPTALVVTLFLTASAVSLFESFRKSHRLGAIQTEQSRAASSIFLDSLNGLRSVRAFLAESYVIGTYRDRMFAYVRTLFENDFVGVYSRTIPVILLLGAAIAGLLFWESVDNFGGDIPLVVTLTLLLLRLFPVIGQAVSILMRVTADVKAARDVTQILESPHARTADRPQENLICGHLTRVDIEGLYFAHLPVQPILLDFNLTLTAGKSYALKGPSGSGKSTLFDLILGFYKPDRGVIRLNGVPSELISQANLRRHVLLLGQQPTVFNDSIRNNLLFGSTASEERIREMAKLAHLEEVLSNMPKGLDTLLTYQGSNLSGGQRQRLGLARALLRDADVLLLDESTSALDNETRNIVVDNIIRAYRERIVVFATHDQYVLSKVDVVIEIPVQKAC